MRMTPPRFSVTSRGLMRLLCLAISIVLLAIVWMSLEPRGKDTWYFWEQWNHLTHALAYATLTMAAGFLSRGPRHAAYAASGLIILSAALEIAQRYVPGRTADLEDAGANLIGISLGFAVSVVWYRMRRRRRSTRPATPNLAGTRRILRSPG